VQHTTAHDYRENPFDLAILPLGSLESHGSHLPFATDAYTAAILAEEVAKQIPGAAVLPVVPYGVSEHYRDFPFTISLRFGTEIVIIGDILESLHREGIRHVFILNGHDGNIAPIENASRKVKVSHPEMKIATFGAWWESIAPPSSLRDSSRSGKVLAMAAKEKHPSAPHSSKNSARWSMQQDGCRISRSLERSNGSFRR
jgi:creatinine amidohydrolase